MFSYGALHHHAESKCVHRDCRAHRASNSSRCSGLVWRCASFYFCASLNVPRCHKTAYSAATTYSLNFTSTPARGPPAGGAGSPAPTPPPGALLPPSGGGGGRSVAVTTFSQLAAAAADPSVASITVAAHIAAPAPLVVAAGRTLSIAADGAACAAAAPLPQAAARRPVPPELCALAASNATRLLEVRPGAAVSLSRLALLGGSAWQGAAALVVRGRLLADSCLFADCAAVGDGGAVLGVASALRFRGCDFANTSSAASFGGAVSAAFGSSLSVSGGSVLSASAIAGSAFAATMDSSAALSAAKITGCWSPVGSGTVLSAFNSSADMAGLDLVHNHVFAQGTCFVTYYWANASFTDSRCVNSTATGPSSVGGCFLCARCRGLRRHPRSCALRNPRTLSRSGSSPGVTALPERRQRRPLVHGDPLRLRLLLSLGVRRRGRRVPLRRRLEGLPVPPQQGGVRRGDVPAGYADHSRGFAGDQGGSICATDRDSTPCF